MTKRTLVLLTYNEVEGTQALLPKIPQDVGDEMFALDGGSTDGTLEVFSKAGVRVVTQEKKGRGEAFRVAMNAAQGEHVVFFSPDGNEDPADIAKLFDELDKGADMAIASRFLAESRNEEDDAALPLRKWANQIFTNMSNLAWNRGAKVHDTINGFRGIRKTKFMQWNPQSTGFTIEYELTTKAFKDRAKIVEIPTHEGDRIGGESKARSIPTGLRFLRFFFAELFR